LGPSAKNTSAGDGGPLMTAATIAAITSTD
jgi:hypothetical protein